MTPPSISQIAPVTQLALSDSKKDIVCAISTEVPILPIGWKESKLDNVSSISHPIPQILPGCYSYKFLIDGEWKNAPGF